MMKNLLIMTLLVSLVIKTEGAVVSFSAGENSVSEYSPPEESSRQDSVVVDDTVKAALMNAFVASPKDTFPLQVGAFRNLSNAEKISHGIKSISGIKVRIVIEDGLYKVRITRFPQLALSESEEQEVQGDQPAAEQTAVTGKDTNNIITDAVPVNYTPEGAGIAEAKQDTSGYEGEIIFFKGDSPWLKRIKYFGESFTLVNALIITILFSIGTMVTLLIIILLNRRRMEMEQKRHQYLMEKYQNLIVDYLFGEATAEDFRKIASDNYSRQVLIDQMIDVSVNLKGEESKKLLGLYKHLGLDRDSLARAYDFRWHKKIKGFRELAFMNIRAANDAMYKALNSSNEILRMEAQIALVWLNEGDHFEFLSHLKRPFSLWEQITLHDLIVQHNIPRPSFKNWLGSQNNTVVMFSLRMIREFRQLDAEEGVINTLSHKSDEIRLMAVQVAGDLGFVSALEPMKRMYKSQDYKTCLEIVKSMGKMPDVSMLGFLKLVLDKEDDVQLQIEATKSIEKMGEEGVKALVKIMKSEYKNYNIIVRHVLDRRIN